MTSQNSAQPQKQGSCITSLLMIMGIATAGFSILGYIVGLFGHQLKVSGSRLPLVNLEILIPLLVVAAFFFGLGYGIELLQKKMKERKARQQQR